MKKATRKLSFQPTTVRNLTNDELRNTIGGSISVWNPSGGSIVMTPGTSVISRNPSGGLPSGGIPSGH